MEGDSGLEGRVLALIRRKTNYYKYRKILQKDYFQTEATKFLFSIIDEYFSSGKAEETKLTIAHLRILTHQKVLHKDIKKECIAILREIRTYKTHDNEIIESAVKDFVQRNLVKISILKGLEALEKPSPDYVEISDYISRALQITTEQENECYHYFQDNLDRILEDTADKRISTSIPSLDKALGGGIPSGITIVFLAPPERGKTLALVNLATAALHQGLNVAYLSLELPERWIARRFDLRISGRPIALLRRDPLRIKNPLAALRKNGCNLIVKDYSSQEPKIEDIRAFIVNYQNRTKKNIDLLVVDYADLIGSSRSYKQERFGIKEVYTNLRRLGLEFNIPIITASQANRKAREKLIVTMEDFAEDYSKACIADVVVAICQTPEELEEDMARLYLAKNRLTGKHAKLRVEMRSRTMYLGDLEYASNKS